MALESVLQECLYNTGQKLLLMLEMIWANQFAKRLGCRVFIHCDVTIESDVENVNDHKFTIDDLHIYITGYI